MATVVCWLFGVMPPSGDQGLGACARSSPCPTSSALSFELMAADTIGFLEAVVQERAHLVGCSDGAIVALLVALRRPDLVKRLALVAGVFHLDGWVPQAIDLQNEPPELMADSYGEISPDGREHFRVVADKLARMHVEEPTLNHR
jgi:pimeloyl-ACP methyl ester carboxylesterase